MIYKTIMITIMRGGSMAKKQSIGKQAFLLRQNGILALGSNERTDVKNDINPISFSNVDKEKYKLIWRNYDMNQCISRYIWKNLPNGLSGWNLERMLYFRGTLAGFTIGGKFYILPYVQSGMINPYGIPTKIKPITYNGRIMGNNEFISNDLELPVDLNGNKNSNYGAVLLYDSIPYSPSSKSPSRYFLNDIILNEMADTFARININIVVSNKKILLIIKDRKQRDIVQKELEMAFGSDCPFGILSSELPVESVQNTSDYNADDLFNTIKNYDAIRCFMSGISSKNFGTEKKERLVSGELVGNEEQKDLILDIGFDLRKEFCDLCNSKFGTNIEVYKRSDFYEEETNGLNQTQEDVEVNL